MIKKLSKIFIYAIILFIVILFLLYVFIFIFIDKTFIDVFVSPNNIKGNIWLLTHADEEVDWPAMGTYRSNIVKSGNNALAIEELAKCVKKYTKNNIPEIAKRCQKLLDQLKSE